ncbi:hypothetical protein ANTRET_LOCUS1740 [Anthophora retusa]
MCVRSERKVSNERSDDSWCPMYFFFRQGDERKTRDHPLDDQPRKPTRPCPERNERGTGEYPGEILHFW